jgi:serine/threonine-protein kinase
MKYQTLVKDKIKFDLSKIPTIPPQLALVIEKTTEQNIADRYQTAQDLANALKSCL